MTYEERIKWSDKYLAIANTVHLCLQNIGMQYNLLSDIYEWVDISLQKIDIPKEDSERAALLTQKFRNYVQDARNEFRLRSERQGSATANRSFCALSDYRLE